MKVIIAGSRIIKSYEAVEKAIEASQLSPTLIIQGGAVGVDASAKRWAIAHNIPQKEFSANWVLFGKKAGPLRNMEMAKEGEALILIWDGHSRGSQNMKDVWLRRHPQESLFEYVVESLPH
jgi:hypothetical protein